MDSKRRRNRSGFTLIEVLLVLVILVTLSSLAVFYARGAQKDALVNAAKTEIGTLKQSVEMYQLHVRNFPSSSSGLSALLAPPSDLRNPDRWKGPYLEGNEEPIDPWDMPYQYQLTDADHYQIWSFGPDGAEGTEDDIRSSDL